MFGLLGRLISGAVAPLIDRVSDVGTSLARKLAFFVAAAMCFVVVIVALTTAFALWIARMAGPIAGSLAVAGLYLVVGMGAVFGAMRRAPAKRQAEPARPAQPNRAAGGRSEQIDQFTAPLLDILHSLGLKREQLAVMAGVSVAKQLRPLPLLGLAILAGFLLGRVWKGWNAIFSADLVATLMALFSATSSPEPTPAGEAAKASGEAATVSPDRNAA